MLHEIQTEQTRVGKGLRAFLVKFPFFGKNCHNCTYMQNNTIRKHFTDLFVTQPSIPQKAKFQMFNSFVL